MPYLTDGELLIGLDKEAELAKEITDKPMYAKFVVQINATKVSFANVIKETKQTEINWHADVGETKDVIKPAVQMYIKWKDMLLDTLPGSELTDWVPSNATPDEVAMAIENLMNVIEDNKEDLNFNEEAISELEKVSEDLDAELTEDREAYRKYRQNINEKNKLRSEAKTLFFRIRRFIRRDFGYTSVEYGQLKDRAVKEASSATEDLPETSV
ncbi:MAG: hypothetical protein KAS64_11625 [Spirochaetes bacterium]|nr:hypothetical protein [Spirochaetota bacterium]